MPALAIAAVAGISTVASGMMKAQAHSREVAAKNKAAKRKDKYNLQLWKSNREVLKDKYRFQQETVDIARINASTNARFTDAINQQKWQYELLIENAKHMAAMEQYRKSEQLYADQVNLNSTAARLATEAQFTRLKEMEIQKSFELQDLEIESMLESDVALVTTGSGRTGRKAVQSTLMKKGMDNAKLVESLTSGRRDVMNTLNEIAQDQAAGNLQAWAQKMLKPGKLPDRPMPLRTPIPIIQDPRKPTKHDYGPKPFKSYRAPDNSGAMMGAALFNAFGSLAGGMAGTSASQFDSSQINAQDYAMYGNTVPDGAFGIGSTASDNFN